LPRRTTTTCDSGTGTHPTGRASRGSDTTARTSFSNGRVVDVRVEVPQPVDTGADKQRARAPLARVAGGSSLADDWLASRRARVRARTFETDRRYVVLVKRYFGSKRVQDVEPRHVAAFHAALRAGTVGVSRRPMAEWTVVNSLKTLRAIRGGGRTEVASNRRRARGR
jgi:hypothetical protein